MMMMMMIRMIGMMMVIGMMMEMMILLRNHEEVSRNRDHFDECGLFTRDLPLSAGLWLNGKMYSLQVRNNVL